MFILNGAAAENLTSGTLHLSQPRLHKTKKHDRTVQTTFKSCQNHNGTSKLSVFSLKPCFHTKHAQVFTKWATTDTILERQTRGTGILTCWFSIAIKCVNLDPIWIIFYHDSFWPFISIAKICSYCILDEQIFALNLLPVTKKINKKMSQLVNSHKTFFGVFSLKLSFFNMNLTMDICNKAAQWFNGSYVKNQDCSYVCFFLYYTCFMIDWRPVLGVLHLWPKLNWHWQQHTCNP